MCLLRSQWCRTSVIFHRGLWVSDDGGFAGFRGGGTHTRDAPRMQSLIVDDIENGGWNCTQVTRGLACWVENDEVSGISWPPNFPGDRLLFSIGRRSRPTAGHCVRYFHFNSLSPFFFKPKIPKSVGLFSCLPTPAAYNSVERAFEFRLTMPHQSADAQLFAEFQQVTYLKC